MRAPPSHARWHGFLFLAVTSIGWALNWPAIKILLREWPPLFSRGVAGFAHFERRLRFEEAADTDALDVPAATAERHMRTEVPQYPRHRFGLPVEAQPLQHALAARHGGEDQRQGREKRIAGKPDRTTQPRRPLGGERSGRNRRFDHHARN